MFDSKDFVRVRMRKYEPFATKEEPAKQFSVDPQLTNLDTLRLLITKAFHINGDFVISYCIDRPHQRERQHRNRAPTTSSSKWTSSATSRNDHSTCSTNHNDQESPRYLPMLNDNDLNMAMYAAAGPELDLKIDVKPMNILDEWDIIDADDVIGARSRQPSSSSQFLMRPSVETALSRPTTSLSGMVVDTLRGTRLGSHIHQLHVQIGEKRSNARRAAAEQTEASARDLLSPLDDKEWADMLEKDNGPAKGRLNSQVRFRLVVYQRGVAPSLRSVVWRHLLNVYPEKMNGEERIAYTSALASQYLEQKRAWQQRLRNGRSTEDLRLVANAVRKDVVRTDRSMEFFSGDENSQPNLLALFNLLTTFALCHPDISYCQVVLCCAPIHLQGMSDLAAPLLYVMRGDEAQTYICFCALMERSKRNFSCDGRAMTRKFQHLSELIQHYDPILFEYLRESHADDLLFAYRWLILELKREFTFDESLRVMEVMWASLPPLFPQQTLKLYDVDLTLCANLPVNVRSSFSLTTTNALLQMAPVQSNGSLVNGNVSPANSPLPTDDEEDVDVTNKDQIPVQFDFCAAEMNDNLLLECSKEILISRDIRSFGTDIPLPNDTMVPTGSLLEGASLLSTQTLIPDVMKPIHHAITDSSLATLTSVENVWVNVDRLRMKTETDLMTSAPVIRCTLETSTRQSDRVNTTEPIPLTSSKACQHLHLNGMAGSQGGSCSCPSSLTGVVGLCHATIVRKLMLDDKATAETNDSLKLEAHDQAVTLSINGTSATTTTTCSVSPTPGEATSCITSPPSMNQLFAASIGRRIKQSQEQSVLDCRSRPVSGSSQRKLSLIPVDFNEPVVIEGPAIDEENDDESTLMVDGVTSPVPVADDCTIAAEQVTPCSSHVELTLADIYDICVGQITDTRDYQVRRFMGPADVPPLVKREVSLVAAPPLVSRLASMDNGVKDQAVTDKVDVAKTTVSTGQDSGYGGTSTPYNAKSATTSTPSMVVGGQKAQTPMSTMAVKSRNPSQSTALSIGQSHLVTSANVSKSNTTATPVHIAMQSDGELCGSLVNVEYPQWMLPPPSELGDGNPFLMFICLTMILEHRDYIIEHHMGFDEIGMHFDRMVRAHRAGKILRRARRLYGDYLREEWLRSAAVAQAADGQQSI